MKLLLQITREQKDNLEKAGLLKYKKTKRGRTISDANFYVASKTHKGNKKTYYVVEEYKILKFLGLIPSNKVNYDR